MEFPVELNCTARKPDGTPAYGVRRMLFAGRVLIWRDQQSRSNFYDHFRTSLSLILGRDMSKMPVTWDIPSAPQMAEVLATYPAGYADDDEIVAALTAIGMDTDALRDKLLAPDVAVQDSPPPG